MAVEDVQGELEPFINPVLIVKVLGLIRFEIDRVVLDSKIDWVNIDNLLI